MYINYTYKVGCRVNGTNYIYGYPSCVFSNVL